MIIVGMTGPIAHGKSTFANALAKLEPKTVRFESSDLISEVANKWQAELKTLPERNVDIESVNQWIASLPQIIEQHLNTPCVFEQVKINPATINAHPIEYGKLFLHVENMRRNPSLQEQTITPENKESFRPLLQWLGGYLADRVDSGIWYNEIARRVKTAADQGYRLCIVGGLRFPTDAAILRKLKAVIIKIYRPGYLANDMLDPTERERENIPVDTTIVSDGGIDDVQSCAAVFYRDISSGSLQSQYIATQSRQ